MLRVMAAPVELLKRVPLFSGLGDRELKQISRERTFPRDIADRQELEHCLRDLAAELGPAIQAAPPARTITLKLRYADFASITRRRTQGTVVTDETLGPAALQLFTESWDSRPLRLMGLGLSNFILSPAEQPPLFELPSL